MIKWYDNLRQETREFIWVALVCIILTALFFVTFAITEPPRLDTSKMDKYAYYVQSGDTLWGLASEYCPDGIDYREWIAAVRDLNDMDGGYIYEGQKIYLWTE